MRKQVIAVESWVESTLQDLSLREKIGQLLHPTLTYWDRRIPQSRLTGQIIRHGAGGAFMAGRPFRELRTLARQVLDEAKVPVVFSGDCECGAATAKEGKIFGSAMSLAAVADPAEAAGMAREVGCATAIQSKAVGVRWSFAPVVDINYHPENPITNTRSYGDDVERIITCSAGYLKGLEENGVAATLKHFPGDGMDSRDQHVCTTFNTLDFGRWDETYGRIYRAGMEAGASSIMVGHIALPCRSTKSRSNGTYLPATADPAIQEDLLRGHLGFDGVIISDAIGMGGMAGHFHGEAERVVVNLASGSDMVLFPMNMEAAVEAVLKALDEGILDIRKIEASVRRILKLKHRLGLAGDVPVLPSDEDADAAFRRDHIQLADRLARASVTLQRDEQGLFPLRKERGSRVLVFDLPDDKSDLAALAVVDGGAASVPDSQGKPALQEELEKSGYEVVWIRSLEEYEKQGKDCDLLIYLFRARPQAGRNSIKLCYNALQSMDFPRIFSGFPCVFLSLASPYLLWDLPNLPNLICIYSGSDAAQRAAVQAMTGVISFRGRCPVVVPPHMPMAGHP